MFLLNALELCQSSTLTRHRAQCIRNGIIGLNIFVAGKNGNAAAMWIAEQQENGSRFTKDLEHWKKKKERKNTDNEDHLREQMCIVPLRRAIAFEAAFTETQRKEEKRLDHDVAAQFVEAAMLCRTYDEIMSIEHNQDYGKSIATMNDDGTGFYPREGPGLPVVYLENYTIYPREGLGLLMSILSTTHLIRYKPRWYLLLSVSY